MAHKTYVIALLLALQAGVVCAQTAPTAMDAAQATAGASSGAPTVQVNPSSALYQNAQRGWFFYQEPVKPKPLPSPKLAPVIPSVKLPPPPKEDRCKKMDTWTADCGFVNPGTSFQFQSKERDALLHRMAMAPDNPQAVENFQYYQKWVLDRSIEVANEWYYNTVENPQLSAMVKDPISAFGLKLMTEVKSSGQDAILEALRSQHAIFVYFSKHDCSFCISMAPTLSTVQKETGLEVWNASLDQACMPGYEKRCIAGAPVLAPAEALRVTIVPAVFLYVPPNTWIRVATGVTDARTIQDRATSFFSAYRTALLKGVANGAPGRPSVDFSGTSPTGTAQGVASSAPARLPTQSEISKLLNIKK